MIRFPWKKKKETNSIIEPENALTLIWLQDFLSNEGGIPLPNWQRIESYVKSNLHDHEPQSLWNEIAKNWIGSWCNTLPHDYQIHESDNFLFVSPANNPSNKALLDFLERCRNRLLYIGKDILDDKGFGKHVVFVFSDIDSYYDYISLHGPEEGTYGLSSGMYLNYGYGHFVFPADELGTVEPVVAHEMTHALLSHLPLPVWLDEGMAVNLEAVITGQLPPRLNKAMLEVHHEFWNPQTIQEFWLGTSFHRPDEGQQLSYQLAQVLVTNLSKMDVQFKAFINQANFADAGLTAFESEFPFSLEELVSTILGEGDWEPTPKRWS